MGIRVGGSQGRPRRATFRFIIVPDTVLNSYTDPSFHAVKNHYHYISDAFAGQRWKKQFKIQGPEMIMTNHVFNWQPLEKKPRDQCTHVEIESDQINGMNAKVIQVKEKEKGRSGVKNRKEISKRIRRSLWILEEVLFRGNIQLNRWGVSSCSLW